LEFIEYEFDDAHPKGNDLKINKDAWLGNESVWDSIIEKISVKINLISYLLRIIREKD
jgi:hypothetical protein